jgi:hypothetical protein
LRAALVSWDRPGNGDPEEARAALAGLAWEGPDCTIFWGWPDDHGRVELRPGNDCPEVCSVLPPALSLALSLRRSGAELGSPALVIGDGFLARIARAVAVTVGFRVATLTGRSDVEAYAGTHPHVVIETTGERRNIDWALESSRDWGRVFSMSESLMRFPLNYYTHVHRRALTLTHVPGRPLLCAGEEEIVERGAALLAGPLRGITPALDESLDARVLPEGVTGRLARERSGWGLLLVEGQ